MARWIQSELKPSERKWDWVLSPNSEKEGSRDASCAVAHGAFDDDPPTLQPTLARILSRQTSQATSRAAPTTAFRS